MQTLTAVRCIILPYRLMTIMLEMLGIVKSHIETLPVWKGSDMLFMRSWASRLYGRKSSLCGSHWRLATKILEVTESTSCSVDLCIQTLPSDFAE
jgi:hypothetical protein